MVIGFRPFGRFLSTPSARRATSPIPTWRICDHISIHALREEGDQHDFHVWCIHDISIHALREEGDAGRHGSCAAALISIHALREEGDRFGL